MTEYILPPSRRVELVEHIARTGSAMPTAWRREKYWTQRLAYWRRVLLDGGMRPLFVEWELASFRQAVARESQRQRLVAIAGVDAEGGQP